MVVKVDKICFTDLVLHMLGERGMLRKRPLCIRNISVELQIALYTLHKENASLWLQIVVFLNVSLECTVLAKFTIHPLLDCNGKDRKLQTTKTDKRFDNTASLTSHQRGIKIDNPPFHCNGKDCLLQNVPRYHGMPSPRRLAKQLFSLAPSTSPQEH